MTIEVGQRLQFANGFAVDIHNVQDGEVFYRRWAPGVKEQGYLECLGRMPVEAFIRQAEAVGLSE